MKLTSLHTSSLLIAATQMAKTQKAIARSLERLASGTRINSAKDDAASLSISTGLESQVRGLRQSLRNINDTFGSLETAESGLASQTEVLQRLRELAVQASNGTLSNTERASLDEEAQQLFEEFRRISDQTEFNGKKLLDGNSGLNSIQVGSKRGEEIGYSLPDASVLGTFGRTTRYAPLTTPVVSVSTPKVSTLTMMSGAQIYQNVYAQHSMEVVGTGMDIYVETGSGTYFTYHSADGTDYNVWYNIDNGGGYEGGDPGGNSIEVQIETWYTADDIAAATAGAMNGYGATVYAVGFNWYITDTTAGVSSYVNNQTSTSYIGCFPNEVTGSAAGGFTIYGSAGSNYYVWYNVDGAMQDPGLAYTGIRVDVNSADSANTIATKTRTALTTAGFSISGATNQVILTSPSGENFTVADSTIKPVGTGFGVSATGGTTTNTGGVSFATPRTATMGSAPFSVELADINEDGILDMLTADFGAATTSIALGNGDGTFRARSTLLTGSGPLSIEAIDLNGDGHLDLVTGDYFANTISIFLGTGTGTFGARTTLATGSAKGPVITTDLNNDGHVDIVSPNASTNNLTIWLGRGNGQFTAGATITTTNPFQVAAADFNGDGNMDLVNTNLSVDMISVRLGNGDGTFATATTLAAGDGPLPVVTADLNGDGFADIISVDSNSDTASIYLGNGDGTFQSRQCFEVGDGPASIRTADINGDGIVDLLSADTNTNTASILLGVGDGTFQPRQTLLIGTNTRWVTTGDLNGDGVDDLVAVAQGSTSAQIFLTNTERVPLISLTSQSDAEDSLALLDDAIAYITSARADISAIHSRMEFAASHALIMSENIAEARSRMIDTDVAVEAAELVRNQILQQAHVAVMAQANLNLNVVLELLKNL